MSGARKKRIPAFSSEDDERRFWAEADSTEYVDWDKAEEVALPSLKPSVKSISLRLPAGMLEDLKILANRRDVAYQALIKIFLAERLQQEYQRTGVPKARG